MNILLAVITILLISLLAVSMIAYFKDKTLEEIRGDVYGLFLEAEHKYKESGQGQQKMKWVVSQARKLLPEWIQIVLTEEVFERIIQVWFDCIKDLLDDGKMNNSKEV